MIVIWQNPLSSPVMAFPQVWVLHGLQNDALDSHIRVSRYCFIGTVGPGCTAFVRIHLLTNEQTHQQTE